MRRCDRRRASVGRGGVREPVRSDARQQAVRGSPLPWLAVLAQVRKDLCDDMNPQFRASYSERGRSLVQIGCSVESMEPEDLYAVLGYLLELAHDREPEARLAQEAPLGSPPGVDLPGIDPPKIDGLIEG